MMHTPKKRESAVEEQQSSAKKLCQNNQTRDTQSGTFKTEEEALAFQIVKANQSLNKAEEIRNQTRIIMQPYANWEQYLTPAPLSIAIMGELVFISSQTDFSINKNPPKNGYKYIKYPDSFRACLMQVCNSGWWAFNEAHKNMDQIRLHTMTVPDYMKNVVKILFQGNEVQAHLGNQLKNINDIANDCRALAKATEKRFSDVINFIQELLQACINAKKVYGDELENVKMELEKNKLREQRANEIKQRTLKAKQELENQLQKAQENFSKALDSVPSGWDILTMNVVESLTETVKSAVDGMVAIATCKTCSTATKLVTKGLKEEQTAVDPLDEISIYSHSAGLLNYAEKIKQFVKDSKIQWRELYNQEKETVNSDFYKGQFEDISITLEDVPECDPKNCVQELCQKGIDICDQLAKYAPDGKCEKSIEMQLINKIKKFTNSARSFDSKSKRATKSSATTSMPPLMYKVINKSGKISAAQQASENARFRIEQIQIQLDKAREDLNKTVEKTEENEKEMNEILLTMRNCDLKQIDFNTTLKMLVKGMDAMGRVKQQWETMVHFFQMVSNIVKASLNKTLKNFVETSKITQENSYNANSFSKDLLYTQAFQATNVANLVHMISQTYTEVSAKYLMDRVSSLGTLMTMDTEKSEFKQELEKLRCSCDDAQKAILQLVLKNKEEFERNCDSRIEKIGKELLAILPPAAPEEIKSIQETVKSEFTEEDEEQYC